MNFKEEVITNDLPITLLGNDVQDTGVESRTRPTFTRGLILRTDIRRR